MRSSVPYDSTDGAVTGDSSWCSDGSSRRIACVGNRSFASLMAPLMAPRLRPAERLRLAGKAG